MRRARMGGIASVGFQRKATKQQMIRQKMEARMPPFLEMSDEW